MRCTVRSCTSGWRRYVHDAYLGAAVKLHRRSSTERHQSRIGIGRTREEKTSAPNRGGRRIGPRNRVLQQYRQAVGQGRCVPPQAFSRRLRRTPNPEYGMVEIGPSAIRSERLSSTRASQGFEPILPPATNLASDFTVKSETFVFSNL